MDNIKCIAIVISKGEVEHSITGCLASILNVFLLRYQHDVVTRITSTGTQQKQFLPLKCNSLELTY